MASLYTPCTVIQIHVLFVFCMLPFAVCATHHMFLLPGGDHSVTWLSVTSLLPVFDQVFIYIWLQQSLLSLVCETCHTTCCVICHCHVTCYTTWHTFSLALIFTFWLYFYGITEICWSSWWLGKLSTVDHNPSEEGHMGKPVVVSLYLQQMYRRYLQYWYLESPCKR